MSGRAKLALGIGLLAVAGLIFGLRRPQPTPQQAVAASIRNFVDGVNAWQIPQALRSLSPRFSGGGLTRGDIGRGLFQARHDWGQLRLFIAHSDIAVEPDGRAATVKVQYSLTATRPGGTGQESLGEDKPEFVTVRFEREGREWCAVSVDHLPYLTGEGLMP
jgi:hypothetical protein